MFLGQYRHNLDEKGSLMIPARYRELLMAAGAFMMQGLDRCLMVMTDVHFNEIYERINAMNMADPNARLLRRLILSTAYPVEIDKVGRISVPQMLRQANGIEREAIVAGQGEYFEVWNPAQWNEQINQLQDVEMNNQRFATLDLSRGYSSS